MKTTREKETSEVRLPFMGPNFQLRIPSGREPGFVFAASGDAMPVFKGR